MKKYILFSIIVFSALWVLGSATASAALERSGRWLTYDGAHPYLVGYDLQQLFTDSSYTEAQVKAKIDTLAAYGTTCFRVWLNTWFLGYGHYYPYTYSGGKFNLDSFSSAYWTRVKNLITYAKSKDIIVEVVVFSEYPALNYWTDHPTYWRTSENSNGVFSDVDGDLFPEFFTIDYTQSGKNLTTYQLGLAAKAIDELKLIGNVFFQVHNEFPGIGGTGYSNGNYVSQVYPWQQYMADYFHDTKEAIVSVHAHETGGMNIYGLDYWKSRASVDILNFHPYSSSNNNNIDDIGAMFGTLYTYGKVLMFDESHAFENSTYTDTVTREMWAAFTNGIYYLAYTDDPFIIGDSGWISRAGRIQTLKNISDLGDWWNATRNPSLVTAGPGQYWQGIANNGNFYVYYFTGTKTTTAVSINLPAGTYDYKWFDTRSWNANGVLNGQVSASSQVSIPAPVTVAWDSSTGVVLVINKVTTTPYCGDNSCNNSETCSTCPTDCGICPTTNPIAHWKFDETSGTTASDFSGNGNTGTLVNGPVWTTGKLNGALNFDGTDDYVVISHNTLFDSTNLTIAFWFYARSVSGGWKNLINKVTDDDTAGWGIGFNNGLLKEFGGNGVAGSVSSGFTASTNTWYHAAVTFQGDSIQFYVDGQPKN